MKYLFAENNGIEKDDDGIAARKEDIRILLKALIGRNILGDDGFYPIYHQKDNAFQEALGIMNEQGDMVIGDR